MGYGPDLRKELRAPSSWREISIALEKILDSNLGSDLAEIESIDLAKSFVITYTSYRRMVKILTTHVGEFAIHLQAVGNEENKTVLKYCSELRQFNELPEELKEYLNQEVFKHEKISSVVRTIADYVSEMVSTFTTDLESLQEKITFYQKIYDFVRDHWSHVTTGTKDSDVNEPMSMNYRTKVDLYMIRLRNMQKEENAADKADYERSGPSAKAGGMDDKKPQAKEAPKQASYAEKAKDDNTKIHRKLWGDYSTSEDDEDVFSSFLNEFGESASGKSFIEVPADFKELLPVFDKAYRKLAEKWDWEYKYSETTMLKEGFTGTFLSANETEKANLRSKLSKDQEVELKTFVSFLSSPMYSPNSVAKFEPGNVVSAYVMSRVLRKKYNEDYERQLLKVALKGGDAGESVIKSRMYGCFKTGSACAKLLFITVDKMLNKILTGLKDESMEEVLKTSEIAFTSHNGMMINCFHNVTKMANIVNETTDRKGKVVKKRVQEKRTGKDRPNLDISKLELSNNERKFIRDKVTPFNNIEKVIADALEKLNTNSSPLMIPKIIKVIVDLAYDKISEIRRVNKTRRQSIRSAAAEAAGEDKKVTQAHWVTARAKILKDFEEIPEDVFSLLDWNLKEIEKLVV